MNMKPGDKLHISNEMRQFDLKNRDFYDQLSSEEQKKFSTYLMLRWGSSVDHPNPDLQTYYILSMNQNVNRNFWDLGKHPKLQWLLLTTVSPDMGVFRHEWIAYKGKNAKNKRAKLISELYPDMKIRDAEQLADQVPDQEIRSYLSDLGWTDKQIKEAMK
jgi:hypothetical protein